MRCVGAGLQTKTVWLKITNQRKKGKTEIWSCVHPVDVCWFYSKIKCKYSLTHVFADGCECPTPSLTSLIMNSSTRHSVGLWFTLLCPFKSVSPLCRAWYKSEVVDWDIPSWLLAQGPRPVMNAAIICWCMKREVHHRLLHRLSSHDNSSQF